MQEFHDYFVYTDSRSRQYYYDTTTQEVTYNFPSNGFIFDPVEKKLIHLPPGFWVDDSGKEVVVKSDVGIPKVPSDDYVSPLHPPRKEVIELSLELQCIVDTPLSVLRSSVSSTKEKEKEKEKEKMAKSRDFDKEGFFKSIWEFQNDEYKATFFKKHKQGSIFFRKMMSFEDSIKFSSKPITTPILRNLQADVKVLAIKAFKKILIYTHVLADKKNVVTEEKTNKALQKLVFMLYRNISLRDEVYFQLISQTTGNPNHETNTRTWELFLIISSLFPPTRDSELYILAHIGRTAFDKNEDEKIRDLAQFSYIRLQNRACIGKEEEFDTIEQIYKIKDHPNQVKDQFYTSLYEIMWYQRKKTPLLQFPFILYYMVQLFITKNGLHTEGIFKEKGNVKIVNMMSKMSNENMECLKRCGLFELCTLINLWFRELSNSIIPMNFLPEFVLLCDSQKFLNIPSALPKTNMYTLMYLIGFLQDIINHKEENKLTINDLANIFGPSLVKTTETEPERVKNYAKLATKFVNILIEQMDTSQIYPLNISLLN